MRRKDREISSFEEILEIVSRCELCRLAMCEDGAPYAVPMNFGYEAEGEVLTFYFHCAGSGRRVDILRKNPRVCVELDVPHGLYVPEADPDKACGYGYYFESIIGFGNAVFVEDPGEKRHALKRIMKAATGRDEFDFGDREVAAVTVLAVRCQELTGKRRMRTPHPPGQSAQG